MSANRIQKYMPATRVATVAAPAVSVNCAAFAMVGGNGQVPGDRLQQFYQLAWEAARQQVTRKHRFRQAQRVSTYWN